jgi:hypothetical protein
MLGMSTDVGRWSSMWDANAGDRGGGGGDAARSYGWRLACRAGVAPSRRDEVGAVVGNTVCLAALEDATGRDNNSTRVIWSFLLGFY